MAKAKTKKEKIVDLKPKAEKITDEQLKEVQDVVNEINRAQMEIGMMETKKHAVLHHISISQETIGKIRTDFEKEYGTADVDIQTGVINYPKENGEANS
tara:strand:+ start:201 stop:497 length:297 start_codon:yes stop_codon:yes gene_type:complete